MKEREELELILKLIGKYNLPLSPILEYAVKEKMEEYPEEKLTTIITNNDQAEDDVVANDILTSNDMSVNSLSEGLRIVDYGERTIAVVGNTKPHKDALKSIGGYFVFRTQWGPAWVFRDKKRDIIQAYINGDTSVITREEEEKEEEPQKKRATRYIIRVKYPDGRVFDSNLVWETLVDVIKYAGPEKVKQLNIKCMGDNLVSSRLNENPIYRSAQKEIGRGLYVCTYSSTDIKFKQIVRINLDCRLGLEVEKVYIDENGNTRTISLEDAPNWRDVGTGVEDKKNTQVGIKNEVNSNINDSNFSVKIGDVLQLFPSQLVGKVVKLRIDKTGRRKIVVKSDDGPIVEVYDSKFLYEKLNSNEETIVKPKESLSSYDKDVLLSPPKKTKVKVGDWIQWKPTGDVGKIIGFKQLGPIQKIVLRLKGGSEMEVYDNPHAYDVIMRK